MKGVRIKRGDENIYSFVGQPGTVIYHPREN
jgi:hypothetical protein